MPALMIAGCNSSVKRSPSDTQVPVITSFVLTSGTPTTNQTIDFTVDAADNKALAAYLINEDATPPLFTDPGWQSSKPATYTVSAGFGPKTVYAWAKDSAGNVSAPSSLSVSYERPWQESSFTYRRILSFDNSARSEDLVYFPVLVKLTTSNFNYLNAQDDGEDIRFKDAQSGDALYYEIESWNPSGDSFIWVKVPRIDGGTTTDHIYMYYGDTSAVSAENPSALWSDYELVYHLGETGTSFNDSSANHAAGTAAAAATPEAGMIGGAFRSDSSPVNYINSGWTLNPALNDYTVEVWVKGDSAPINSTGAGNYTNGPIMAHYSFSLGWDHTSDTYVGNLQYNDGGWAAVDLGDLQGSQWYYVSVTASSIVPEIRTYRNGILAAVDNVNFDGSFNNATYALRIGDDNVVAHPMDGLIDEARVSTTVHSADWIRAQYLSMTDSFVTFGAEITSSDLY